MRPLQNLHALKTDMEKNGWVVDSFRFCFKNIDYIVLVILFEPDEPREQYALLHLDFLRADNFNCHLLTSANAGGLMIDPQTLRLFFGIKYAENLGEILQQFSTELGYHIPESVSSTKTDVEKRAIVHTLCKKDNEETNKVNCYAVKRNPVVVDNNTGNYRQQKRSPYNDNKTRLLRVSLYEKLGKDQTISFCYCDDPERDYPDEIIIENWTKNKPKDKSNLSV